MLRFYKIVTKPYYTILLIVIIFVVIFIQYRALELRFAVHGNLLMKRKRLVFYLPVKPVDIVYRFCLDNDRRRSNSYVRESGRGQLKDEFEDTKGVIRIRISKKNRQHNGQEKKYKQRSTKHTHKTKDRVIRAPLKTGGELRCSDRVAVSAPLDKVVPIYWLVELFELSIVIL